MLVHAMSKTSRFCDCFKFLFKYFLFLLNKTFLPLQVLIIDITNQSYMEFELDILLEKFLFSYPNAQGVTFHSMELPITKANGAHTDTLERYKDIPMMSIDDAFNTTFNFIVTDEGTIIIFFVKNLHFISVFVDGDNPNKELANKMYANFKEEFETVIDKLYETQSIH